MGEAVKTSMRDRMQKVYEAASFVEKNGYNSHGDYAYATVDDVKAAANKALRAQGIYVKEAFFILLSETAFNKEAKIMGRALVNLKLTLSDGAEEITLSGIGEGRDSGDKAVFKAQAGAIKYALMSGLLIATGDADDPEATEADDEKLERSAKKSTKKAADEEPAAKKAAPQEITPEQRVNAALDVIAASGDAATLEKIKLPLAKLKTAVGDELFEPVRVAFVAKQKSVAEAAKEKKDSE